MGASRGVIFNLGFLLQDEDNDDEIDDADYEDTFFATLVVSMAL